MKLIVDGMTCGHCARAITHALQAVNPAIEVQVDLEACAVHVSGELSAADATAAVAGAGYAVRTIEAPSKPDLPSAKRVGCCCGGHRHI